MFFPVLISAARKALAKVLHDYITRTGQASFGGHTESSRFPFKTRKTPKSVCEQNMQCRLFPWVAGKVWNHHPAARTLLAHGVYFLLINSNV